MLLWVEDEDVANYLEKVNCESENAFNLKVYVYVYLLHDLWSYIGVNLRLQLNLVWTTYKSEYMSSIRVYFIN